MTVRARLLALRQSPLVRLLDEPEGALAAVVRARMPQGIRYPSPPPEDVPRADTPDP